MTLDEIHTVYQQDDQG